MHGFRPSPPAASFYVRIALAWLLAMLPMFAGFQSAASAHVPVAFELCHGAPAPSDEVPGDRLDHSGCCLAACTPASAPPPASVDLPATAQRIHAVPPPGPVDTHPPLRSTHWPQSARAPPEFSA